MSFIRRRDLTRLKENTIVDGKIGKYKIGTDPVFVKRGFRKCRAYIAVCTEGVLENEKVRICVPRFYSTSKSRNTRNFWYAVRKWEELTSKFKDETDMQHLVRIVDTGITKEGKQFLVTEFCETTLDNFRQRLEKREESGDDRIVDVILEIIHQIGKGYRCLRKMGLIHGNFRGDNIGVNSIDPGRIIVKIDFSVSIVEVQNDEDIYNHSKYSTVYCPPPEYKGGYWGFEDTTDHYSGLPTKTTTKSEIWYIGCFLFKIITGRHPYSTLTSKFLVSCLARFRRDGTHSDELEKEQNELNELRNKPVEYPEEIPHEMKSLLVKMLEKDPEKRISFKEFFEHPLIIGNDYEGQDLRERIEYIISNDELDECFVKIVCADVSFKCMRILL